MDLPEHLLIEILLRLTVKSLILLKCVCKSWCALIESPKFIAIHLSRAKNTKRLLLKNVPCDIDETPPTFLSIHSSLESIRNFPQPDLRHLPFLDHGYFADFVCHCNGLLYVNDVNEKYLFNPATRQVKLLPPPPCNSRREGFLCSEVYDGLGYDPNTNDYKVVILAEYASIMIKNHILFKADLYSLSTDSWREVDAKFPTLAHPRFCMLFDGRMHWSGFHRAARERAVLFSFNMSSEVVEEIGIPDALLVNELVPPRLDVLRESLTLISTWFSGPGEDRIDIWMMNEYGVKESWTKIFSVGPGLGNPFIKVVWNDELLIDSNFGQQLILCPLTAGHQVQKFDVFGGQETFLKIVIYKESLVSVKKTSDHPVCS
ncbi:F-box protein CPR1-like [Coffea eugenioides]|uniref:F-box protein CPR1-like n=1 Tax=Coffea eugenioides TaxID=49369 RepID=UPI000F60DBEF|nr:F-box protein CPR1-like [Coffea eugenioides]